MNHAKDSRYGGSHRTASLAAAIIVVLWCMPAASSEHTLYVGPQPPSTYSPTGSQPHGYQEVIFSDAGDPGHAQEPVGGAIEPAEENIEEITSCGSIRHAGRYVLRQDLSAAETCLRIENIDGVSIDCDGFSIAGRGIRTIPPDDTGDNEHLLDHVAVVVLGAARFTLANCQVDGDLSVQRSPALTLSYNKLRGVHIFNTRNTAEDPGIVSHNTLDDAYEGAKTSYMNVTDNRISASLDIAGPGVVNSFWGDHNVFSRNVVDGRWNGIPRDNGRVGFDDGFFIGWESGDRVTGNTVGNVWDLGIETLGAIEDLMITDNRIDNALEGAIGGWHNNSWDGVTIARNVATNTSCFLKVHYVPNTGEGTNRGLPPSTHYFRNISVLDNSWHSAIPALPGEFSGAVEIELSHDSAGRPAPVFVLAGNQASGNQFQTDLPGMNVHPPEAWVDRGRNTLGPPPTGVNDGRHVQSYTNDRGCTCTLTDFGESCSCAR